jgi:LemA protein
MMDPNLIMALVIGGVVLIPLIWFIATYNAFVRLKNYCRNAWAGIDTELKRRYDLIPNLVETVKGYADYERETLERVVELRNRAQLSSGSPKEQARDENEFVGGLRSLFALVENYPELKASAHYLELQKELANTEDRIQAARRFYNANVRDLNTRIEVIPSNIIAGLFGFKQEEFFEIESACERAAPQVRI